MPFGWIAAASAALVLSTSPQALKPPPAPGAWRQVGASVTSKPGKALHFYRTPQNPKAVGIVVTATSSRRLRLFWASYCEFESDDVMTGEAQATITGVRAIYAYPPVIENATLCYVWVNTKAVPGVKQCSRGTKLPSSTRARSTSLGAWPSPAAGIPTGCLSTRPAGSPSSPATGMPCC